MAKRLVFSKKALNDIYRIVEFNNRRNKSNTYSKKGIKNLHNELKLLIKHPLIGKCTDLPEILLLVWDKFYIFYKNSETVIEIRAIYHQKEDVSY